MISSRLDLLCLEEGGWDVEFVLFVEDVDIQNKIQKKKLKNNKQHNNTSNLRSRAVLRRHDKGK